VAFSGPISFFGVVGVFSMLGLLGFSSRPLASENEKSCEKRFFEIIFGTHDD
jgi:hypothetical protein